MCCIRTCRLHADPPPSMAHHQPRMADNAELRLNIADVSHRKKASRQASMDSCDLEQPHRRSLERLDTHDLHEDATAADAASPATPTYDRAAPTIETPVVEAPVVEAPVLEAPAVPERPKPVLLKPSLSPRRRITRAEHGGTFSIYRDDETTVKAPKGKAREAPVKAVGKARVVPPYDCDPDAEFDAPTPKTVADPVPPSPSIPVRCACMLPDNASCSFLQPCRAPLASLAFPGSGRLLTTRASPCLRRRCPPTRPLRRPTFGACPPAPTRTLH